MTVPRELQDSSARVRILAERGVIFPCPASVEVDEFVIPEQIAAGVVIHAGCRIRGGATWIGPGCEVGAEAPATIEECQLGHNVALKGGYFSGATFLDGANVGSSAHIRPGTLLEEEASAAHAVGLKQTIFLPFVTAGSLINFCDCLMAGGTSRKQHSEIGSSYIHFNYSPHQDKATASLIGDVPRGVMLDQPPIFLGGQGGLVGPVRIGFGSIIPAGTIFREDAPEGGQILCATPRAATTKPFQPGAYRDIRRIVRNNLNYIGNIRALLAWYGHARRLFESDSNTKACHHGAVTQLKAVLTERMKRFGELAGHMPRSIELARGTFPDARPEWVQGQELLARLWPEMQKALEAEPEESVGEADRDRFLAALEQLKGRTYLKAIASVDSESKAAGTAWLQAIVKCVVESTGPSF